MQNQWANSSILSNVNGSMPSNTWFQPAVASETTSSSTSSMDNFMGSLMGSLLSNTNTSSSYDSEAMLNNAITAMNTMPSEVKLNIPQTQQAKGMLCNSYKTVSRSSYGNMWG